MVAINRVIAKPTGNAGTETAFFILDRDNTFNAFATLRSLSNNQGSLSC